jgi:hypothetical protein
VRTKPELLKLLKALVVQNFYELDGRGKDASGLFLLDNDTHWKLTKAPLTSSNGAYLAEFKRTIDAINPNTNFILGHARAKTKGSEYNNLNNHPIEYRGMVGVHNGTIINDDKVFDLTGAERFGQVDSEAIFAAIYSLSEDINHVKEEELKEAVSLLTGGCASLSVTLNNPNQMLFIKETNPMDIIYFENMGVVMLVSERTFVSEAPNLFRLMRSWLDYEVDGSMLSFNYGVFPISSAGILDLQSMTMENIGKIQNYTNIFTIKTTPKTNPNTSTGTGATDTNRHLATGYWIGGMGTGWEDDIEETCWMCGKKLPEEDLAYDSTAWKYTCEDCLKISLENITTTAGNIDTDNTIDIDGETGEIVDEVETNQTVIPFKPALAAAPPIVINSMSKVLPMPIHESLGEGNIAKVSSHISATMQHFVQLQKADGCGRDWHRSLNYDLAPPFQMGSLSGFGFRKDAGVGREGDQKWKTQGEAYEIGFLEGMYKGAWATALQTFLLGKMEGVDNG